MKGVLPKIAIILAGVFAFTPFYLLTYLLLIVLSIKKLRFSKTFSTYFGRFILSLLILAAIVMVVGLIMWFFHVVPHPFIVASFFFLTVSYIDRLTKSDKSLNKFLDPGDAVSIGLALIAPAFIFASFFMPKPSSSALYQLVSAAWDNSSHVVMLETASMEKSFVYGSYDDVKDKTIFDVNAYPQAWHLSTAHIANGTGTNLFSPQKEISTLWSYSAVLFIWYFIGAFIIARISWMLFTVFGGKKEINKAHLITFITSSVLVQIMTIMGALSLGFANYIGLMAYLALLFTLIIENDDGEDSSASYLVAIIAGAAASLCWFLPAPAIALSIWLAYSTKPTRSTFLEHIRNLFSRKKHHLILKFISALLALLVTAQIAIFVIFSAIGGSEQLNARGGYFKVSLLLLATMSITTAYFLGKRMDSHITKLYATICPLLLFAGGLYVYQLLSEPEPSYYFFKIIGLLAIPIGIFFAGTTNFVTSALSRNIKGYFVPSIISISVLAFMVIGTNQSTATVFRLLQKNSIVSVSTAQAVVRYFEVADPQKEKIVIVTSQKKEGFNGELANKLAHLPYTCADRIANKVDGRTVNERIKNLGICAKELSEHGQGILVVADSKTKDKIISLHQSNIRLDVVN